MLNERIKTYEKYAIIVNAYNHIIDVFGREQDETETTYSVFSDIVEDYTDHRDNIDGLLDGDCFVDEKSKRDVLKHMNHAENLLIDNRADNLTLYPVKRAIRIIKDMDVAEDDQ